MKLSNPITIVIIGFVVRILFLMFGAEIYYGKEDFHIGGDTNWWVVNIVNLIEHGVYTDNIDSELGFFTRTPGFSFLIGFFYLITGKNMGLALELIPYFQVITDSVSIYLIYKITSHIFRDHSTSIIVSLLYAFYPFILVWNVIVYAESFSLFLFLFSIFLMLKAKSKWQYLLTGALLSLAILTRIQLILSIPIFGILLWWKSYKDIGRIINVNICLFGLALIMVYGAWPIRNYVNHDKIVFAQHLGDRQHWSPDYMKFMEYIWAVKVDYEPQYSQIIKGDSTVVFPISAYAYAPDSLILDSMVNLARTCGEGFSYFARSAGYRSDVVVRGEDCNNELVSLFDTLILHQKQHNPLSYYLIVPLGNLRKAIFKNALYKSSSRSVFIISMALFTYRTILVLLGIIGLIYLFFNQRKIVLSSGGLMITSYVIAWYFFQSFIYRNMEMRYLLHADILLLIPAGYILSLIYKKIPSN